MLEQPKQTLRKASMVRQETRLECHNDLIRFVGRLADSKCERGIGDDYTAGYVEALDIVLHHLRKQIA